MDRKRPIRIRYIAPIDYSKVKTLTDDEAGFDSPEDRQFDEEQKAKDLEWEQYLATVDLSQFGTKVGVSSHNSKQLRKLIREADALKTRLEEHMKNHKINKGSKKLLNSLGNLIRIVDCYYKATRDRPFDWIKRSFLPKARRGSKLSYPDVKSDNLPMGSEPEVTYAASDDDECETVNGSETVEGHFKGLNFSKLARLYPPVHRGLVYRYLRRHGIRHFYNKDEQKLWREFTEFDSGIREAEVTNPEFVNEKIRSIEANHPIVSVVGNFAVSVFNKACNKHVKEDEPQNLHDFEFMECKYVRAYQFYHFYLIIEAIEEGNIGTYLAEVTCNSDDGASVLCKFVLTDHKPSGTKAMAASYLSCLESMYYTMDDLYNEKRMRLANLGTYLKDPQLCLARYESRRLKDIHAKVWEGLIIKHAEHTAFHFPLDCKRMTDPADWSLPKHDCCSGMVLRDKDNIYNGGYDYYNPYCVGKGVWYF